MKLHTADIKLIMPYPHNEIIFIDAGYPETTGKTVSFNYPGMIPPRDERRWNPFKHAIMRISNRNRSGYAMINIIEVNQSAAKSFSDSLVSKTYSQNAFLPCIFPDKFKANTSLFRYSGSG